MAKISWQLIACEDNRQSWGVVAFGSASLVQTALQQTQKETQALLQVLQHLNCGVAIQFADYGRKPEK